MFHTVAQQLTRFKLTSHRMLRLQLLSLLFNRPSVEWRCSRLVQVPNREPHWDIWSSFSRRDAISVVSSVKGLKRTKITDAICAMCVNLLRIHTSFI